MEFRIRENCKPNRQHVIWHTDSSSYVAESELGNGTLKVRLSDDFDMADLIIYDMRTGDKIDSAKGADISAKLEEYGIRNDGDLREAMNKLHPSFYIKVYVCPAWQADYLDDEGCVSVGVSKFKHLTAALQEIKALGDNDILDVVDTIKKLEKEGQGVRVKGYHEGSKDWEVNEGDVVTISCQGIELVGEVSYASYTEQKGWYIYLINKHGQHRCWHQYYDGGEITDVVNL